MTGCFQRGQYKNITEFPERAVEEHDRLFPERAVEEHDRLFPERAIGPQEHDRLRLTRT